MSSFIFFVPHDSVYTVLDTVDQAAPGMNANTVYTSSLNSLFWIVQVFMSSFIFVIPHDSVYTVIDTVDQAVPGINATVIYTGSLKQSIFF